MDGDQDLDAVIGNSEEQNRLHLNDGGGNLVDVSALALPALPQGGDDETEDVVLGDVDGAVDIFFGNDEETQNQLYLNDGSGAFFYATISNLPGTEDSTSSVALGDVDSDGDLDAVIGNGGIAFQGSEADRLLLNDDSGVFTDGTASKGFPPGGWTTAVRLADLDGDADLDAFVEEISGSNAALFNDGTGGFPPGGGVPGSPGWTLDVALGDVDGDIDLDALLAIATLGYSFPAQNSLLLDGGTGTFVDATATNLPVDSDQSHSVALVDLDEDGDLDALFGSEQEFSDRFYRNDGGGTYSDATGSGSFFSAAVETVAIAIGVWTGTGARCLARDRTWTPSSRTTREASSS